jgi:hypothetical protein
MKKLWLLIIAIIAGFALLGLTADPAQARDIYLTVQNGVACFTDYPKTSESTIFIRDVAKNFQLPDSVP